MGDPIRPCKKRKERGTPISREVRLRPALYSLRVRCGPPAMTDSSGSQNNVVGESGSDKRLRVVALLVIVFAVIGLSYLFNPEARTTQRSVEQELRGLPLPPDTTDQGFSAGYQPSHGRASRTVVSAQSAREMCGFFSSLMVQDGWRAVERACYPGDPGRVLLSFRKGRVTCRIEYLSADVFGMKRYAIVSTWTR
jgi:hypothetical protein